MKSFKQLLLENHREYSYRIKMIVPITDTEMDIMDQYLKKYDLLEISNPRKTIMQKHPMDFSDISSAEIYMVDITIGIPVSSYILQQELKAALNIPEKFIIVRKDNEPLEIETQMVNSFSDMNDEAKKEGLVPASLLSTNSHYEEEIEQTPKGPFYGDEYNSNFLSYLAKVRSEREDRKVIAPAGYKESMADMYEEEFEDYNANIPSAPKIITDKNMHPEKYDMTNISDVGNYDEDAKKFYRIYRDKATGKRIMMSKQADPIRRKRG